MPGCWILRGDLEIVSYGYDYGLGCPHLPVSLEFHEKDMELSLMIIVFFYCTRAIYDTTGYILKKSSICDHPQ